MPTLQSSFWNGGIVIGKYTKRVVNGWQCVNCGRVEQEAVTAMACCYETKKAWVKPFREADMKQCMSCQKRVATLTFDDDGLWVCGECDDLKEKTRLNKRFYQDAL